MTIPTREEIRNRWDILPAPLKEAMVSDINLDFVERTCAEQHIPEDKKIGVFRTYGYVLLGFIHAEDFGGELAEALSINKQVTAALAAAVNGRIFMPLKTAIDGVYQPPEKFRGYAAEPSPVILRDVGAVAPKIVSQVGTVSVSTAAPRVVVPPIAPKPNLTDPGWSKTTPAEPVVKLSQATPPPNQPTVLPKTPPTVKPAAAAIPIKGPVGEFERMAIQSGQKTAPPTVPTISPRTAEPAPVIIHEDAAFKAAQQPPNFRLQLPTEKFGGQPPGAQPVKPAVLEFGKDAVSAPAAPAPAPKPATTPGAPRVVHYTDYKSPATTPTSASTSQAPAAGPRQVTEVTTPAVPKVPAAPAAPPEPKVPTAPQPQNKVLYKNYSEATPAAPTAAPTPQPAPPQPIPPPPPKP